MYNMKGPVRGVYDATQMAVCHIETVLEVLSPVSERSSKLTTPLLQLGLLLNVKRCNCSHDESLRRCVNFLTFATAGDSQTVKISIFSQGV